MRQLPRVTRWLHSSLWLLPLSCSVLAFFLQRRMVALDLALHVPAELTFSEGTATQLLSAIDHLHLPPTPRPIAPARGPPQASFAGLCA